jgi:hypothetical protein
LKKVEKRLKMMYQETPLSKVRKLKRRMFNCIDITREINELKDRLKQKLERENIRNKAKRRAKSSLTKREKEVGSKPTDEEILRQKKQSLKENLKINGGIPKKNKKLSKGLASAIFKDGDKKIVIPEFSQSGAPF